MSSGNAGKLIKRIVVLTGSDADIWVMKSFSQKLERFAWRWDGELVWRVIDGLNAYDRCPDTEFVHLEKVRLEWVATPEGCSHADSIAYGMSLSVGEHVLMMSPDMEGNIEDISDFMKALVSDGSIAIVSGRRVSRIGVPVSRRYLTGLFNNIVRCVFRLSVRDVNTCMALLSPEGLNCIMQTPQDCPSPPLYTARKLRRNIKEIPITVRELPGRKSNYTARQRIFVGLGRLREVFLFALWVVRSEGK